MCILAKRILEKGDWNYSLSWSIKTLSLTLEMGPERNRKEESGKSNVFCEKRVLRVEKNFPGDTKLVGER